MGGFTRPRDLRAANWFPGGPYIARGKVYESPPEAAYEPHTVFLFETRHRVRHGIGRVDAKDHVVGVCRAVDFVKLVRKYNSKNCPPGMMESMDNACWPWLPKSGKVLKPTRWWGKDECLEDIMKEIYEDDNYVQTNLDQLLRDAEEEVEEDVEERITDAPKKKKKRTVVAGPEIMVQHDSLANALHRVSSHSNTQGAYPPGSDEPQSTDQGLPPANNSAQPPPPTSPAAIAARAPAPDPSLAPTTHIPAGHSPRAVPPHIIGQAPTIPFSPPVIRAQYLPRLAAAPFWRPLLTITLSTRPLALTIARLSKARERGLPFYAAMTSDDRKCLFSYSNRMTNMRLDRARQLTLAAVARLAGHRGGFVGIRFGVHDKGRGVDGEALADPISPEKRIVRVQVADWYAHAAAECALYRDGSEEWGGTDALDVAFMNEWGRRLDAAGNEVPLTDAETSLQEVEEMDDEADTDPDLEEDGVDERDIVRTATVPGKKKFTLKSTLQGDDEAAVALRRKLAYKLGEGHRSVIRV